MCITVDRDLAAQFNRAPCINITHIQAAGVRIDLWHSARFQAGLQNCFHINLRRRTRTNQAPGWVTQNIDMGVANRFQAALSDHVSILTQAAVDTGDDYVQFGQYCIGQAE